MKRKEIDEALIEGKLSYRLISSGFKCSRSAVYRHFHNGHAGQALDVVEEAKELLPAQR